MWSILYFSGFFAPFATGASFVSISVGVGVEGVVPPYDAKGADSDASRHASRLGETMFCNGRNPRGREVKYMAHLPRASILQRNCRKGSRKILRLKIAWKLPHDRECNLWTLGGFGVSRRAGIKKRPGEDRAATVWSDV